MSFAGDAGRETRVRSRARARRPRRGRARARASCRARQNWRPAAPRARRRERLATSARRTPKTAPDIRAGATGQGRFSSVAPSRSLYPLLAAPRARPGASDSFDMLDINLFRPEKGGDPVRALPRPPPSPRDRGPARAGAKDARNGGRVSVRANLRHPSLPQPPPSLPLSHRTRPTRLPDPPPLPTPSRRARLHHHPRLRPTRRTSSASRSVAASRASRTWTT